MPGLAKRICMINGSPAGNDGNSAWLLDRCAGFLGGYQIESLALRDIGGAGECRSSLAAAHGFVFASGTYWDSWGSPLQKFLEESTAWEASSIWLGKPAAVLVTAHSVGGKGVLSRLQGVLNALGMCIPPMSGLVCTLAAQLALRHGECEECEDFWRPDDLEIVCHNLREQLEGGRNWKAWPVSQTEPRRLWMPAEK
jgi:hypothetical protein